MRQRKKRKKLASVKDVRKGMTKSIAARRIDDMMMKTKTQVKMTGLKVFRRNLMPNPNLPRNY